jgi:pyruvate ferredoxin oxidoreductase delta subunit
MKKWDITGIDDWGWEKAPMGATVLTAGNAEDFNTGDWRSEKPVWEEGKCRQCLICWISCPDSSITVKDEKRGDFNYEHCKGCGICAKICPAGAIQMVSEGGDK